MEYACFCACGEKCDEGSASERERENKHTEMAETETKLEKRREGAGAQERVNAGGCVRVHSCGGPRTSIMCRVFFRGVPIHMRALSLFKSGGQQRTQQTTKSPTH